MRKQGNFDTYLILPDDSEMDIRVWWEGYHTPAKTWGPAEDCYPCESEMYILKVEEIDKWPEGLSKAEFESLVDAQTDRIIEKAWEEYDDA